MPEPRRLPNGRWKIRYRDPEGRSRSKTCRTKSEARAFVEDVGHAVRQRTWVAPERGRITLAGLVEEIDPWYQAFGYTAAETGMRWSELVGLRRRGVDLLRPKAGTRSISGAGL